MAKEEINSLELGGLEEIVLALGEKKFRAQQIYEWVHKKQIDNFNDMTNVSKRLIEKLDEKYCFTHIKMEKKLYSEVDNTIKYLFRVNGNTIIESVLMRYSFGNSVCISSQAGCRMACTFCASAIGGLERDLTAGEMLGQVYSIQKDIGERVSNVVIMGSGEPLDNYDNTLKFIRVLASKLGQNLGMRHITLSTCGLIDKINKLMSEGLPINLAVSLHAPNGGVREKLMPASKKAPYDDLLRACKKYTERTGRRVTYEYALISGINDKQGHALELAGKIGGSVCHVNLIPINYVEERGFRPASEGTIYSFADILKKNGVEVTIRRKLGSDINAACGQLRKSYSNRNGL
ncbi:MAG: 23S rRNA (adenine(2503)-C(2))-methyltransferase RlmN [Clostridiales bacterium]|jgi:23S rRNA (adenine2503-C2)-methyltransferase|nr:23S rRNA (adenine(2503)-C(2))-methyltransferase RlmN [Clostridiales bacterium]